MRESNCNKQYDVFLQVGNEIAQREQQVHDSLKQHVLLLLANQQTITDDDKEYIALLTANDGECTSTNSFVALQVSSLVGCKVKVKLNGEIHTQRIESVTISNQRQILLNLLDYKNVPFESVVQVYGY
jgi:hypothetical protein